MSTDQPTHPPLRVFDVVTSSLRGKDGGAGVVLAIRRYRDGRYTYEVAALDEDDERIGGIYGYEQLRATGRRESAKRFWSGPRRAREVVIVSDDHPKQKWRGLYGRIAEELEAGNIYCVEIMKGKGWDAKIRSRDIETRYLRSTCERLPPQPVPRPTTTWHPGRGQSNLRPAHDFDIIDELDQYL